MSPSITPAAKWKRSGLLLALFMALVLALFWSTWLTLPDIWWAAPTYNHGFIILPTSLILIWLRRSELARVLPRQEPLGLLLLVGFVILWVAGQAASAQVVQHVAVVGTVIGTVITVLGRDVARLIAFPLLFLFFMVPEGDFLIPPLQDVTAIFSVMMLRLIDVPVFHSGYFIETPSGLFHVAEACAGLRFLIANIVVATLFAYLSFRRAWKWGFFLLLAVIVPILANGLRAFGIIYIAYITDNEYAVGVDHLVYGWGFFTVVMILLLFIGNLFVDRDTAKMGIGASTIAATPGPAIQPWLAAAIVVVLVTGPIYTQLVIALPTTTPPVTAPSVGLRTDWERLASMPDWRPTIANPDAEVQESYVSAGRRVDLFVAYYAFQRQGAEVVYHANRIADEEHWNRAAQGWHRLEITGLPERVQREQLFGRGHRREVLWWYWVDGTFTADRWQAKWLQFNDRLVGNHQPAAIVAVSTIVNDDSASTLTTIEEFLAESVGFETLLTSFAVADGEIAQAEIR